MIDDGARKRLRIAERVPHPWVTMRGTSGGGTLLQPQPGPQWRAEGKGVEADEPDWVGFSTVGSLRRQEGIELRI